MKNILNLILLYFILVRPVLAQPVFIDDSWTQSGDRVLLTDPTKKICTDSDNCTEKLQITGNGIFSGTVTAGGFDEAITGSSAKVDLGTAVLGRISFASINNSNNNNLTVDLESAAGKVIFGSTTGVTIYQFPDSLKANRLLAGGVSSGGGGGGEASVADAIVSYYKMENSAADTVVTDFQSLNAGTWVGTTSDVATIQGKLSQGFNFDGSNDYIDLGSGASLKLTSAISVAFWAKTTQSATARIAGNRSASGTNVGWEAIMVGGQFRFTADNGTTIAQSQSSTAINTGAWIFCVGTWDGTTLKAYVNGVMEDSDGLSGNIGTGAQNTYIGRNPNSVNYYAGILDNFQIFNRALTDDEILFLYNENNGTEALASAGGGSTINTQIIGISNTVESNHGLNTLKDLVVEGAVEVQGGFYTEEPIMQLDTTGGTFTYCGTQSGVGYCTTDADGILP